MSQKTYTIGELARRSGIPARKIRFYADAGLLSPNRTETMYRVFDDRDLVVLDLIRSLREAGASLASIRSVLKRDASLRELLTVRLVEIEASLRRQKALAATLRLALTSETPTVNDLRRISQMIGHSQAQRHATASSFLNALTENIPFDPQWRDTMHRLISAPNLPDEPSAEQIDSWLKVTELLSDVRLQRALRAQAVDTGRTVTFLKVRDDIKEWRIRQDAILNEAKLAMRFGAPSSSEEGQRIADLYISFMAWNRGLDDDAAFRASISDVWSNSQIVELFWKHVCLMNGNERQSSPEYLWLVDAVVARLGGSPSVAMKDDV